MSPELQKFVDNLHQSSTLISTGQAEVLGHVVDAVEVKNLYGQMIVWGMFNCVKGKFKGKGLANNANTDDVRYTRDG